MNIQNNIHTNYNKFVKINIIKFRVKILTDECDKSKLPQEELDRIFREYNMPQWNLKIAERELELGYLNECQSEYLL